MKKAIAFLLVLCVVVPLCAKDLKGRFGLGGELISAYAASIAGIPISAQRSALSMRTYLAENMGIGATFTMSVNGGTMLGIGTGFLYNIVSETNVNLLTKIGFNINIGEDFTAFSFPILLNSEFFLDRIPNLGLEVGVGLMHLDIVDGDLYYYLGTSHLAPSLGFHYYF